MSTFLLGLAFVLVVLVPSAFFGWLGWKACRIFTGLKVKSQDHKIAAGLRAELELNWIRDQVSNLYMDLLNAGSTDSVLTEDCLPIGERVNQLLEKLLWEESTPGFQTTQTPETTQPSSKSDLPPRSRSWWRQSA